MKISIITVTFNSEKTLESTIDSVRSQNYDELEYIIVDGGSTDGTIRIINKNQDIISKWVSEPDKGISDAFNKGIRMSTGDLIGIINSDDMLEEGALSAVANCIKADTDVLYGNVLSFGDGIKPFIEKPKDLSGLYDSMVLLHPATFVMKRAYDKYGVFNIDYKCCMDRDLLLRMYSRGAKFQYVDRVLSKFRQGGVNQRTYLTTTVSEGEKISIEYGMKPAKAKIISLKKRIRFCVRNLLLCTSFGKKLKEIKNRRH